jgi:hypothetical protein
MKYIYTFPFEGTNGDLGNVAIIETPDNDMPPGWWRRSDHEKRRVEDVTPGAVKWEIAQAQAISTAAKMGVPALIGGHSSQVCNGGFAQVGGKKYSVNRYGDLTPV